MKAKIQKAKNNAEQVYSKLSWSDVFGIINKGEDLKKISAAAWADSYFSNRVIRNLGIAALGASLFAGNAMRGQGKGGDFLLSSGGINSILFGAALFGAATLISNNKAKKMVAEVKGIDPAIKNLALGNQAISTTHMDLLTAIHNRDQMILELMEFISRGDTKAKKRFKSKFLKMTRTIKSLSNKKSAVIKAAKSMDVDQFTILALENMYKAARIGSVTFLPPIHQSDVSSD